MSTKTMTETMTESNALEMLQERYPAGAPIALRAAAKAEGEPVQIGRYELRCPKGSDTLEVTDKSK